MIRVGIYGATGYTGLELIRILRRHPEADLKFATTRSYVGSKLADVFPVPWDFPLVDESEVRLDQVDIVFCCLPAGAACQKAKAALEAGVKAVDLSADFRIKDPVTYEQWYGIPHTATHLLSEAVYGLPEVYRAQIVGADLIANPGCYPTSILLGLYPLLESGMITSSHRPIIADSKSGVSGAGRKPSQKTHFVEASQNFTPYNIGRAHRHVPEMEQEIASMGGTEMSILFSPHLLPVDRGILSTIYVPITEQLTISDIYGVFAKAYANEPFVWLLEAGQTASIAHVVNSNRCALSLALPMPGQLIVCSSIDNLIKGAAGQAVQNMNLMFELEEGLGVADL